MFNWSDAESNENDGNDADDNEDVGGDRSEDETDPNKVTIQKVLSITSNRPTDYVNVSHLWKNLVRLQHASYYPLVLL